MTEWERKMLQLEHLVDEINAIDKEVEVYIKINLFPEKGD